ncbi:TonB-dependent receptor [Crocinitomix catalasitica]|nr:TonB-dependent receptor [Crocinitomix catalasitica]
MKHLIFILSFITLFSNYAFSQTQTVSGKLSSGNQSVPFGTVLIKSSSDSSVVRVALADSLGQFSVTGVPAGTYFAHATSIGFLDYYSDKFDVGSSDVNLKSVEMSVDDKMMDKVTVMKIRPIIEILPDRTVFNVSNTINATGANGFDLLRKAPGVVVDNNNNIIVEGKSGVQIYIDNKPTILSGDDLVNFLKSLQSSDIDKIEIITQPSSKYDAAGAAGIVNIIMKRNKNLGTNGTLTGVYTYGLRGDNHLGNGSLSLNHRNKRMNVYTNYSNNFGPNYSFADFNKTLEGILYGSDMVNNTEINGHTGRLGTDFFLGSKHTIGVLATADYYETNTESVTTTYYAPVGTTPNQRLDARNDNLGGVFQYSGNLNYRFADTLGHEWTIDADYGGYQRTADSYQPNLYIDELTSDTTATNIYRMITPTKIQIITAKTDYSQYLWGGKLGLGAKYSIVNTDNFFDFYDIIDGQDVINKSRSNQFFYRENINAGYVNYGRKLGKRWNMNIGVRVENTNFRGELISTQGTGNQVIDSSYVNLFPSGGITFMQNHKHMWRLNYSRRIQRPNYQNLNPFETQIDEFSYMKGNPFLLPQYISNVGLSHTFKYRFNTAISYSYISNFFAQITDTLNSTTSYLVSENVADNHVVNLSVSLPFQFTQWWSLFANVNGSYSYFKGHNDKFQDVTVPSVMVYAQNTFLLPAGFKFEISGWFSSPSVWGGTFLTKAMGSLDVAVERKFFSDRLTARAALSDVLRTAYWRADYDYGALMIDAQGGWESQKLSFSLSYMFGNSQVKATRKRDTGLEEESGRTGSGGGGGGVGGN